MIVYVVICRARDAAVLVEASTTHAQSGNAPQVTTALLEHLRDHPEQAPQNDDFVSTSNKKQQDKLLKTYVHRNKGDPHANANDDDLMHQMWAAACHTIAFTTAESMDLGDVQEHYFHVVQVEGIFYCCLADDSLLKDQKVNFAFLQALCRDFTSKYSKRRLKNANAYALDKEFQPTVLSLLHYYNTHHADLSTDAKIVALKAQVEDMKQLMGRNISLLLEREQRLDALVDQSEQMLQDAAVFQRRSQRLKRQTMWQAYKYNFVLAGIAVAIIYTLLTATCGFRFQHCRVREQGGGGDA